MTVQVSINITKYHFQIENFLMRNKQYNALLIGKSSKES